MKKHFNLFLAILMTATLHSCKNTSVTGVELNKAELALQVGETETLTTTITPQDADDKTVSWSSSDMMIAEVDNSGKVTAKAAGTASIVVTTADGNKTANCTVIVTAPVVTIEEPEMVFVEGGTFMFGCTDGECDWRDSLAGRYPPVEKTVNSFYISKHLVTQKLWKEVMGDLPHFFIAAGCEERDDHPICHVSHGYVMEFIRRLNLATGKNYSLASSVEWEYAAKGGNKSEGYKYSGSDNIDEVAWYNGNSNNVMHPVGEKLPNELGIYDMSGNVMEWTSSEMLPLVRSTGYEQRGGAWNLGAYSCRVSYFFSDLSLSQDNYTGFRLVLR